MTSKLTRERVVALIAEHSYDSALVDALEHLLSTMDSEPMAEVLSNRPGNDTSTIDRALSVGTPLYRHAQPAPVVPDGYVMVPKEPASEMVKKMRYHVGSYDRNIRDGYKAMLAAAPQEVKK